MKPFDLLYIIGTVAEKAALRFEVSLS